MSDDIHEFCHGRAPAEPWVNASTTSAGARCLPTTSSRAGRYHQVECQVHVRTMMAIAGWSDHEAMEPYLKESTER